MFPGTAECITTDVVCGSLCCYPCRNLAIVVGLDSKHHYLSGAQLSQDVTRVIESVNHKHEQCCYVPCTALPTWTLGLGTEGLVSK